MRSSTAGAASESSSKYWAYESTDVVSALNLVYSLSQ